VTPDLPQDSLPQRVVIGLNKIGMAIKSHAWQDALPQGLTPTQGQILALLRAKGAVGVRLSTIANELGVTAATTSDAVTTLVEKGLVQKKKAVDDGRAIALALTAAGRQVAEQAAGWSDFMMDAVSELSQMEQEVFLRGLIKMIRKLQEQRLISMARMCVNCEYFQPHTYEDADLPHHCAFVDAAFGDRQLQVDCPDQVAVDETQAQQNLDILST
jgi:DNA-binding MarR family transcriptional regulator